ncbi:MAG TPA: hypothetical protein DCS82_04970 [Rhodospirillaceae bacterium]|nr:hypothetical protein [Rhodospirillaceae bacterium]HAT35048.1 hypothetical protein [Rhodospirillaceae bacterium]
MQKGWLKTQFRARRLALQRRFALSLGRPFDPYPPSPEGVGVSPSLGHKPGGVGSELALDWRRAGIEDVDAWQKRVRAKLVEISGYGRFGGPPGINHLTDLPDRDGFRHRSLYLKVRDGVDLPIRMVWHPNIERDENVATIICLQGTNSGMHLSWGEERMPADPIKIFDGADYARQAARHGFLAICLEQSCFGERRERHLSPMSPTPCIDAANHAMLLGRSLVGERASDVTTVVNWLVEGDAGLPVDEDRVYVFGSSAGGTTALFAGALDERISGVLAAGCLGFMDKTLLARRDPEGQNIVPGILRWFELDAVVALCAPRPFLTVSGDRDHIWPFEGAEAVVEAARPVYRELDVPDRLKAEKAIGGHRFYPDIVWPAFTQLLAAAGHELPASMEKELSA